MSSPAGAPRLAALVSDYERTVRCRHLRALQDERARAERKGRDKSAQRALRSHLREKGRGD